MDTMERFHIYKETHANNQINDKNTTKPNIIFETIVRDTPVERTLLTPQTLPSHSSRVHLYPRTLCPAIHNVSNINQ
jgi:hypothetical protein